MQLFGAAVLVTVILATPMAVGAQTPPAVAPAAPAPSVSLAPPVDARALGISLSRIARRLAADSKARSQGASPLQLEYHIDVFGSAPELRFFTGEDLVFGAVPGSAPTHRDMLSHVTPQAFRSPRADVLGAISGAARYGARRAGERSYDRQYEAYRKLIEAGKPATPPKPPQ